VSVYWESWSNDGLCERIREAMAGHYMDSLDYQGMDEFNSRAEHITLTSYTQLDVMNGYEYINLYANGELI